MREYCCAQGGACPERFGYTGYNQGTEGIRMNAIYTRALRTYNDLTAGKKLEDLARALDLERQARVEDTAGKIFTAMLGRRLKITLPSWRAAPHRNHPFAQKYWGFDADIDAEVSIGGQKNSHDRRCRIR